MYRVAEQSRKAAFQVPQCIDAEGIHVVARNHIATKDSVRVQQATQFFGVELFAQCRRAHQVAEHYGELATFATAPGPLREDALSHGGRRCDHRGDMDQAGADNSNTGGGHIGTKCSLHSHLLR